MKYKFGFTLAEVLITLGIIGVVAALTIPTLITKYKNQVTVNQLKKHYSVVSQGFQKMLVDEGVENLYYTPFAKAIQDWNLEDGINIMQKYFNVTPVNVSYEAKYLTGDDKFDLDYVATLAFPDGSLLFMYSAMFNWISSTTIQQCKDFMKSGNLLNCAWQFEGFYYFVDLNGEKGPNVLGRDIFNLSVDKFGQVGSSVEEELNSAGDFDVAHWSDDESGCGKPQKSLKEASGKGFGCAARIIENGWKIDY